MRIPAIAIVGHKGAGKTTLTERLIRRLSAAGLRVAAVKHTSDEEGFDKPGKDSDRLRSAGAVAVGLIARSEVGFYTSRVPCPPHLWLDGVFTSIQPHPDLILYEGHRDSPFPKVECIRDPEQKRPSLRRGEGLIAVVADHPVRTEVPVLGFEPLEAIVAVVLRWVVGARAAGCGGTASS